MRLLAVALGRQRKDVEQGGPHGGQPLPRRTPGAGGGALREQVEGVGDQVALAGK